MKYLMVAMLLVMVFCMTGCVTTQQNEELNRATIKLGEKLGKIQDLEDQLIDIVAKVQAGMIPAAEGKALYENIRGTIKETSESAEEYQSTINRIRGQGASGIDITVAIILNVLSIAGSLLGVRMWRGGVNNRMGDIGMRTPPA